MVRIVIHPSDDPAVAAAFEAPAVLVDAGGTTTVLPALAPEQVARGVAELEVPREWRCERAGRGECGWSGDAQLERAGAPSVRQDVGDGRGERWHPNALASSGAWIDAPWCPRCGSNAIKFGDPDPGEPLFLVDGVDVPSGLQTTDLRRVAADPSRSLEERLAAVLGLLPPG